MPESIPVHAGGDLQAALNAAMPGDVLTLESSAHFQGQYVFPPKAGEVTLQSSAQLPDRRIGPADAGLLPRIGSGQGEAALFFRGSSNWRLNGIALEGNAGGFGEIVQIQDGANITLDRILIDIQGEAQQKRGILGNGRNIALTRSHIAGIWREGQDSQAFAAWDGAGPYTIDDIFAEAASENVLFGGSDSLSAERIPADILIQNSTFYKRPSWRGVPRVVKNLFELKSAKRVTIRLNTFDGNWSDGQAGFSIVFTPRNQEGNAPWSCIEDVLFEQNTLVNCQRGFNVLGFDNEQFSGRCTRIVIRNNDVALTEDSFALQAGGEVGALEYSGNRQTLAAGAEANWVNLYTGQIRPQGEANWRDAQYAAEALAIFGNTPQPRVRGDLASGEEALKLYTRVWSMTGPVIDIPPNPPPQPPPTDPCKDSPAKLRSPSSVRWPGATGGHTFKSMTLTDERGCQVTVTR